MKGRLGRHLQQEEISLWHSYLYGMLLGEQQTIGGGIIWLSSSVT